jgi:tetratricopeptide (TPR) repeat protein
MNLVEFLPLSLIQSIVAKPPEAAVEKRLPLAAFGKQLENIRNLTASLAVVLTAPVVLLALFLEVSSERVVVDPFLVSRESELSDPGTSSAALAQRYAGHLREIVAIARSNYPATLADTKIDRFEPPGEYQVFSNAVRFVAEAVGTKVTHVEGHLVTRPDQRLVLTVRVRSGRRGRDASVVEKGDPSHLDALLRKSATRALAEIAPVVAAVYFYGKGGNSADAIRVAQSMLSDGPSSDYAWAYTLWGFAKLSDGENDAAVQLLERAVEYDPSFALAHYNLGVALEGIAEFAERQPPDEAAALATYKRAVREYQLGAQSASAAQRADALLNESRVLVKLDRRPEALTAVRGAIDAFNYFPTAFWLRGQILIALGRVDEGQRWFERAIRETSHRDEASKACLDLGNALWRKHLYRRAEGAFRDCLTLLPDDESRSKVEWSIERVAGLASKEGA